MLWVFLCGVAWQSFQTPSPAPAAAIGEPSNGCLGGAKELPLDGKSYRFLYPDRHRNFGHPDLVGFIETLVQALVQAKESPLVIGDMSQPRGGHAPGGHASHQTGIDVDLWYAATEPYQPVVNAKGKKTATFNERVITLLRLAATDKRVDRIFVNPGVKRALCEKYPAAPLWLRKIRPWWSHDVHFHVRLACPAKSPGCVSQDALPPGTGCKDLNWWFDEKAQAAREEGRKNYREKIGKAPLSPEGCAAIATAR